MIAFIIYFYISTLKYYFVLFIYFHVPEVFLKLLK